MRVCTPDETLCLPGDPGHLAQCSPDGATLQTLACEPGWHCATGAVHTDFADGGVNQLGLADCLRCLPGAVRCGPVEDGGVGILVCDGAGTSETFEACYPTQQCDADAGTPQCREALCLPGESRCVDSDGGPAPSYSTAGRQACNDTGTGWSATVDCVAGSVCGLTVSGNDCLTPCQVADQLQSSEGCDFWGALLDNRIDPAFTGDSVNGTPGTTASEFGFAVSNTSPSPAHVTATGSGLVPVSATVAPGTVASLRLPWRPICGSGLAPFGVHLVSDAPVTVTQFNPLTSTRVVDAFGQSSPACATDLDCDPTGRLGRTCTGQTCTAHSSSDASQLLPTHLLGTVYADVALGQATDTSGLLSVLATQDQTQVEVRLAGATVSSAQGLRADCDTAQGNLPAQAAQSSVEYLLQAGDVLQLQGANTGTSFCIGDGGACIWANDLTGTLITSVPFDGGAAQPIAVFGGAVQAHVPFDASGSNHLEEALSPYVIWGQQYVGTKSQPYAGFTSATPDTWRVVSACSPAYCPNGATVVISPSPSRVRTSTSGQCTTTGSRTVCTLRPVQPGQPAQWLEFEHPTNFDLQSDQQVELAQYFASASEAGATEGNPVLVLPSPVRWWRTDTVLEAPATYLHPFVNLVVEDDLGSSAGRCTACGQVQVDGQVVPAAEWVQLSGDVFWVATHPLCGSGDLGCTGTHTIHSEPDGGGAPRVGVEVYGYDHADAYGYPGGVTQPDPIRIQPG